MPAYSGASCWLLSRKGNQFCSPAVVMPCPKGFFCGSYANRSDVRELDELYRDWTDRPPPATRQVAIDCFRGYACRNASSLDACPAGTWCPEGTFEPNGCSRLSLCPPKTGFDIGLEPLLIAALFSALLALISIWAIRSQKFAERRTKAGIKQNLLSGPQAHITTEAPAAAQGHTTSKEKISVRVQDLHVMAGSRSLLRNVSCMLPGGQLTAIMGPSGTGKSVFASVVLGRAEGLTVDGTLEFMTATHRVPKPLMGYVPPEEVLERRLTVRELLRNTALDGLPSGTSANEVEQLVNEVLVRLHLETVADTIIGGGTNAASNISGGQLKRVSVAMELVCRPSVLILDGPTDGLDSTVALELLQMLRVVAASGVTVALIMQQPRWEAFQCLDRLLLLAPGGKVVYEGDARSVVEYLESVDVGCKLPPGINPADWVIDLLSEDRGADAVSGATRLSDYLAARWAAREPSVGEATAHLAAGRGEWVSWAQTVRRFAAELWHVLFISFLIDLRDRSALLVYSLLHALMALALASGFASVIHQSPESVLLRPPLQPSLTAYCPAFVRSRCQQNIQDLGLQQLLFFVTVSVAGASSMAAIRVFGNQLGIFRRLAGSGRSMMALAMGRMIADIQIIFLNSVVFTAVWKLMGNTGGWQPWLGLVLLLSWAASGIGYVASLITGSGNAGVLCMIAVVCSSVFNGVEPTLQQVRPLSIAAAPWYISFGTWAAEGTFQTVVAWLEPSGTMEGAAAKYGFSLHDVARPFYALFLIGLAWRCVAVLILLRAVSPKSRIRSVMKSCARNYPASSPTKVLPSASLAEDVRV